MNYKHIIPHFCSVDHSAPYLFEKPFFHVDAGKWALVGNLARF